MPRDLVLFGKTPCTRTMPVIIGILCQVMLTCYQGHVLKVLDFFTSSLLGFFVVFILWVALAVGIRNPLRLKAGMGVRQTTTIWLLYSRQQQMCLVCLRRKGNGVGTARHGILQFNMGESKGSTGLIGERKTFSASVEKNTRPGLYTRRYLENAGLRGVLWLIRHFFNKAALHKLVQSVCYK